MKYETKIFWVMTRHLNENFHSEKSDQASLIVAINLKSKTILLYITSFVDIESQDSGSMIK